jgi:hypothetical protein
MVISLWSILPASAGAAGSEAPAEEKEEAGAKKKYRLSTKSGGRILPIPIFITEPAFGYGLGVAVGYIHPPKKERKSLGMPSIQSLDSISGGRSDQKPPPTITGVAGGYTSKDTWAVAVGHSASWRKDLIRYAGGLAYTDLNSTFYVVDQPLDFNLKGAALYQDISFRLGRSHWFLGTKLLWMKTDSVFKLDLGEEFGEIGVDNQESNNVGVAAAVTYDSRDNTFTPNTGQLLQFDLWRFDEILSGDYEYWRGRLRLLSFWELHPKFVLGLRAEYMSLEGRGPFYAYPFIKLRGIPALRYPGNMAGTLEVEGRWNILPRWALVGFFGSGVVYYTGVTDFLNDRNLAVARDGLHAGGLGVRYFMMQDLGLWLGVDVARSPEDYFGYITVGHAW